MHILHIIAHSKPEKDLEIKQALKSALDKTLKFHCVKNCCCQSLFEDNTFHIEQEWENEADLESYLQSKDYKYLIGAITVLGELVEQKIINAASVEEF